MPSSYSCGLCKLTHDHFSENKIWENFRENLKGWNFIFYHKDEYEEKFPALSNYPNIIIQKPVLKILISQTELAKMGQTENLIDSLKEKLSSL